MVRREQLLAVSVSTLANYTDASRHDDDLPSKDIEEPRWFAASPLLMIAIWAVLLSYFG